MEPPSHGHSARSPAPAVIMRTRQPGAATCTKRSTSERSLSDRPSKPAQPPTNTMLESSIACASGSLRITESLMRAGRPSSAAAGLAPLPRLRCSRSGFAQLRGEGSMYSSGSRNRSIPTSTWVPSGSSYGKSGKLQKRGSPTNGESAVRLILSLKSLPSSKFMNASYEGWTELRVLFVVTSLFKSTEHRCIKRNLGFVSTIPCLRRTVLT